jgi:hypothetical protein
LLGPISRAIGPFQPDGAWGTQTVPPVQPPALLEELLAAVLEELLAAVLEELLVDEVLEELLVDAVLDVLLAEELLEAPLADELLLVVFVDEAALVSAVEDAPPPLEDSEPLVPGPVLDPVSGNAPPTPGLVRPPDCNPHEAARLSARMAAPAAKSFRMRGIIACRTVAGDKNMHAARGGLPGAPS